MKLTIDTDFKTIKIENRVKIKDLIITLKKLLPADSDLGYYEDYYIDSINLEIPVYYPNYIYPPFNINPFGHQFVSPPIITCNSNILDPHSSHSPYIL